MFLVTRQVHSHGTRSSELFYLPQCRANMVLHFTSRFMKQPSFGDIITFAGTKFNNTKKARNLGVIMDNNLSFSSHINEICKKSTLAIRSIGRNRKYLSLDGLKMLVSALFISRLDYCNCLLYCIPECQRDRLQRIQNTGPARGFGYTVSRAILIQVYGILVYGILWLEFGYKVFSFS